MALTPHGLERYGHVTANVVKHMRSNEELDQITVRLQGGGQCDACMERIVEGEPSYEIALEGPSSQHLTMHAACYLVWHLEQIAQQQPSPRRQLG